jgi:ribosome biogenesis GTPase
MPEEMENVDLLPKRQGMVLGMFPGGAIVRSDGQELICSIAKTYRAPDGSTPLAVGDNVTVALTRLEHASETAQDDKDRADGMILLRAPRATALSRPQPRSGKRRDEHKDESFEKVIVANMDILLIVVATVQPALRQGLIDRFLIIAERGELKPLVVVNKIDLAPADREVLADLAAREVEICQVSAATGAGLDELRATLTGKRSVLGGASGVGKSTLINALIPGAGAVTGAIRLKDQRGRHTTAAAKVYDLGGGMIIDTPGVRELGVLLRAAELPWYFPEFDLFSPNCRFNDCTHTHEPNCAVQQAVQDGKIHPRRYDSYLRILETLTER